MKDQADKLRKIINNLKSKQILPPIEQEQIEPKKKCKVITITSGKGGVGKTNITINLAIALSELGHKVTILDADFGLANIDVLFGIIPKYTLLDVIHNRKNILEILCDGPQNIKFISGGSGVEDLIKLDEKQLKTFVSNISLLDKFSDIILIDTSAGLSESVMSFVLAADEVVLVTTPEPTSITDAYAMIKMLSNRDNKKPIKVIVNKVENLSESTEILNRLKTVSEKFLFMKLEGLGHVLRDDLVVKAVKIQEPFTMCYPKSQASKCIKDISSKLMENQESTENIGVKSFINRLVSLLGS